jgi:hypothetical protein
LLLGKKLFTHNIELYEYKQKYFNWIKSMYVMWKCVCFTVGKHGAEYMFSNESLEKLLFLREYKVIKKKTKQVCYLIFSFIETFTVLIWSYAEFTCYSSSSELCMCKSTFNLVTLQKSHLWQIHYRLSSINLYLVKIQRQKEIRVSELPFSIANVKVCFYLFKSKGQVAL